MSTVQCNCGNFIATQNAAPDGTLQCVRCGNVLSVKSNPFSSPPQVVGAAAEPSNGMAILGFILSIVSLVGCIITAPFGAVISYLALSKPGQRGLAIAGLVIGIVQSCFLLLAVGYVLIMIFIVGSLAAGAAGAVAAAAAEMQIEVTQETLNEKHREIYAWKEEKDSFPSQEEGDAMVSDARDAWSNPIHYTIDGEEYQLVSGGPDGVLGNEDDISVDLHSIPAPVVEMPKDNFDQFIDGEFEKIESQLKEKQDELKDKLENSLQDLPRTPDLPNVPRFPDRPETPDLPNIPGLRSRK